MSRRLRPDSLAPLAATLLAGELARQLLSPRAPLPQPLPVTLRDHFSEAEIARGRRFARPQRRLASATSAVELVTLVALARLARSPSSLARRAATPAAQPLVGAALTGAGLAVVVPLPSLPLRALARRRALAAGLDTQSWKDWAADLAKVTALGATLSGAAASAVVGLSGSRPRDWWRFAALGGTVLGAGLGALAPVVLDPLFNDFTPLPDGPTRADLLGLARDAGVPVKEVYSVDASRRTSAANAYVTGLGPTKRVVVFDTMLDRYSLEEVRLVVAHELAHLRHRDVARGVAYAALVSGPLALAAQRLAGAIGGPDGGAGGRPLAPAGLPALALAAQFAGAGLSPFAARLSRAMERRADAFSLRLAGAPEAFVSFERRAALQNLSDLQPGWLARQLATHPPVAERIGAALAVAVAGGSGGGGGW